MTERERVIELCVFALKRVLDRRVAWRVGGAWLSEDDVDALIAVLEELSGRSYAVPELRAGL